MIPVTSVPPWRRPHREAAERSTASLDRLGTALDAPYAGVVIAVALAVVLVLGLVLLRR